MRGIFIMTQTNKADLPDIDIEAERKLWLDWWLALKREPCTPEGASEAGWLARARLAAERERELLDLLADAQHAVCCYSCPEPREGEPDRHCETCVRIGEALTRKGPSNER